MNHSPLSALPITSTFGKFFPQFPAARRFAAATALGLLFVQAASAAIAVKSGEKIAFLGDSITQEGWNRPMGYVKLVMAGLAANGVQAEAVPAGISGHKSNQMLARLDKDVISKKPQWMTVSCGVNDVWHGAKGVPLDDAALAAGNYVTNVANRGTYKENIAKIVAQAEAAGIQVVLLTATVIKENLDSSENAKLAPYNEYLRTLAREKNLRLADLNAMCQERIKAANQPKQNVLTYDGVHMGYEGNKVMATGVLQALGMDAAQLQTAQAAWVKIEAQAKAEAQAAALVAAEKKAKEAAVKEAAAQAAAEKSAGTSQPENR